MTVKDTLKRTFLRKRTLVLLLAVIGRIGLRLAESSSYFAEEIFAKHIFKVMSVGISSITGIFPFSVAEMMIIIAPFLVIALIVGFALKLKKNLKDWLYWVLTFVLNCACIASTIYFFYSFGCGINYYRYPVADYFEYTTRDSSKEELAELLAELADQAGMLREKCESFDENGVYTLPMTTGKLGKEARLAYIKLSEEYPIFSGHYPKPKPVMLSHLMSYTKIIGIYTCWTMEANVDIDISDYEIGSTMCHELAHLRGFIREDEANFISYMACMASDNVELQYSGTLHAFVYTANALSGKDSELYGKVISEHYYPGMWKDFEANREYWKQFEKAPKVSEVTEQMNDTYLKANNQEDGVESYGRVVDLLLAKYRKDHGLE